MKGISTDSAEKHINIEVEIPSDLEVLVDNERLIEILTVLIENAVHFTPEYGKVSIKAESGNSQVVLRITDTGIGIAPEVQKHLFDKFYNVATDEGKQIKGVGLGLYMCKHLLQSMHGDITVASQIGKGSTFSVQIPQAS